MDLYFRFLSILAFYYVHLCTGEKSLIDFAGIHASCGSIKSVSSDVTYTFDDIISSGGKSDSYLPRYRDLKLKKKKGSHLSKAKPGIKFNPPTMLPSFNTENHVSEEDGNEGFSSSLSFTENENGIIPPNSISPDESESSPDPKFSDRYAPLEKKILKRRSKQLNLRNSKPEQEPKADTDNKPEQEPEADTDNKPEQEPDADTDNFSNSDGKKTKIKTKEENRKFRQLPKVITKFGKKKSKKTVKTDRVSGMKKNLSEKLDTNPNNVPMQRHSSNRRVGGQGKVPNFVRHIIQKVNGIPIKSVTEHAPLKDTNQVGNAGVSPHDILGSLGPEKLDQLRQILNSAAGPYGLGGDNREIINAFSEQQRQSSQPRYRVKRRAASMFPMEQFISDNSHLISDREKGAVDSAQSCKWIFQKGQKCDKLVVNLQYWIDGTRDCNLEYLQIRGDRISQKICGGNDHLRSNNQYGGQVIITHFRNSTSGATKFKGFVQCE